MSDAHAEAIKARITAYTKAPTLDPDEAKALGSLPAYYTLIYLSRRYADEPSRVGGTFDLTGRRLSTRVAAKTVTNARLLEDRIYAAFHLNPLSLDGELVDVRYESGGGEFEHDEGFYSALTDWIYVR